jgi:4'-phosphopantetheinyl transferase
MFTIPVQRFQPWSFQDFRSRDADVHVWLAELDQSHKHTQRLAQALPAEDRVRAGSYRYARDRRRFIVARAYLRTILGLYVDEEPDTLHFVYGPYGKPALSSPDAGRLHFSVSRSHNLALYAIAYNREVGVDIERLHPLRDLDMDDIARYCFSPHEQITWRDLPAGKKHQAFFNLWTRKEAYMKAVGIGLLRPLDQIDVTTAPQTPTFLRADSAEPDAAGRWSIESLRPRRNYAAALVVEGSHWQFACWSAKIDSFLHEVESLNMGLAHLLKDL